MAWPPHWAQQGYLGFPHPLEQCQWPELDTVFRANRARHGAPAAQHCWGGGLSLLQTQLSPPEAARDSTAADVTISACQRMKISSLNASCAGTWQVVTSGAPRGASHRHPSPGQHRPPQLSLLQPGSPPPPPPLHHRGRTQQCTTSSPQSLQAFFCPNSWVSGRMALVPQSSNRPLFQRLRGYMSPFHAAQKPHP